MNGAEHYRAAEEAAAFASGTSTAAERDEASYWLAMAQVRATLALAAAVGVPLSHASDGIAKQWMDTLS